jgi:hypothetical protein
MAVRGSTSPTACFTSKREVVGCATNGGRWIGGSWENPPSYIVDEKHMGLGIPRAPYFIFFLFVSLSKSDSL